MTCPFPFVPSFFHVFRHLYKKAQLLVECVHGRFGPRDPTLALAGTEQLTVMSDNVIPAMLRAKGVLVLDAAAVAAVAAGPLPAGDLETVLRGLAVEACERLIRAVNNLARPGATATMTKLTCSELDMWMWGVLGKSAEHRAAARHFTQDTIFY